MNKVLAFFKRFNFKNLNPVMVCLWGILFLECFYIFFVLLNYYFSWMHIEVYDMNSWVLSNGKRWQWEDFARVLNTDILEGPGAGGEDRISRPVSNFFDMINPKFRAWCWNYIPPHPALAIWWPASFIILPIFLYKFFRNMKCNAYVSFGGVILYLSSIGFLAPNVMYFRPAKSLVNIFAVLSLYLGSKIYRKVIHLEPGGSLNEIPGFRRQFLAFIFTMFVGFFADETGVFIYVMACALLYPIMSRPKERVWLWTTFFALPFAYAFVLLKALPWLHLIVSGKVRDLSHFDLFPGKRPFFLTTTWWNELFTNAQWLLNDHPHLQLNAANLFPNNKILFWAQLTYTLSMLGVGLMLIRIILNWKASVQNPDAVKGMPKRQILLTVSLFFPFVIFHTLIMQQLMGLCYYAALYSLIYYIALTFLFQFVWERDKSRFFGTLFPLVILIGTCHGLLFSTYRVDILDENKWDRKYIYIMRNFIPQEWSKKYTYSYDQIFTGQTPSYFKNLNIMDGIKKSECRYLYTVSQWAQLKGKKLPPMSRDKKIYCNSVLAQDKSFRYEYRYSRIEQ